MRFTLIDLIAAQQCVDTVKQLAVGKGLDVYKRQILVGGQAIVGRIRGIERPALAPLIPTKDGVALLIDCGANVDARSSHLVQFARMGSIYMENVMGIAKPRVGIVNIGAEEEKGNALVKETVSYTHLEKCEKVVRKSTKTC